MLDILARGEFARVIACDPHQNIYQFNHVDGRYLAGMKADFQMSLPQSFRFGHEIARLLTRIARATPGSTDSILEVQGMPGLETSLEVVADPSEAIQRLLTQNQKMTVLARKNSTLFFEAIELIAVLEDGKSIDFIGGFGSFTKEQLLPVMDLFYLGQDRKDDIQSNYVIRFRSLDSFRSKCEEAEDVEWLTKFKTYDMLREKNMGPEKLQDLIGDIEDKLGTQTGDADVIFSTVHQAKGLGFENVVLLEDYLDDVSAEDWPHSFKMFSFLTILVLSSQSLCFLHVFFVFAFLTLIILRSFFPETTRGIQHRLCGMFSSLNRRPLCSREHHAGS